VDILNFKSGEEERRKGVSIELRPIEYTNINQAIYPERDRLGGIYG
jgi:hypothetical protein